MTWKRLAIWSVLAAALAAPIGAEAFASAHW